MPNQKKPPAPPTPQAVAYGARLKAIFELSGATRAELAVHLKSVIAKQSNAVAMTRFFDGTDIVPRAVADAIIAFALGKGADRTALDRLVNGTSNTPQPEGRSGDAQRLVGEAGPQDAGADSSAWWGESLGELRAAAQLEGSPAKRAEYWKERRDELEGELRQSEQRVVSLKTQLAGVKGEATASAELRRQLGRLRKANLGLEAEAAAARKALQGRSPETSEQAARELRRQLSTLRTANQRLREEVEMSNQALKREKEEWEARAQAAEEKVEVLRRRLDAAADYVRVMGADLAERDAVIAEQTRRRESLEAEMERQRIEADALRDEVGRLGARVLDLEEQLKSTVVSEPETRYTAPLPRRDTRRDLSGLEPVTRRYEPPLRAFPPPPSPDPTGSDILDRATWDALWTPPPPPPSSWQRCRDAFTPTWFLAGSTLLTAVHTQIVGVTLYTLHVMIGRGTLPPGRAVLTLTVACAIVSAVFWTTHRWIYRKNRAIGIVAFIILTGCAALTLNGQTVTLTPPLTEYAHTHGITWADRGDGKSCDEPDYCTPK